MSAPVIEPGPLRERLVPVLGERHHRTAPAHLARVADQLREGLAASGFRLEEQEVRGPFGVGANLIGRRPGTGRPDRVWIVGAHYDTVPGTPGADDNGVAVAGLLVLAGLLRSWTFRDTVELVFWDMEETQTVAAGALLGSRTMAREARRHRRAIQGVIDLEMIGLRRTEPGSQAFPTGFDRLFPDVVRSVERRGMRGDFIAGVGNPRSARVLDALGRAAAKIELPWVPIMVRGLAALIPHFYRSDHAPFWRRGYPAVMVTDTADFRNGHYHRPGDTLETLDLDFAGAVMTAVGGALVDLAGGRPPG